MYLFIIGTPSYFMKTGAKCVEQTLVMGRTVTPWSFGYHWKYLACLAASPPLPVTNVHLKWYIWRIREHSIHRNILFLISKIVVNPCGSWVWDHAVYLSKVYVGQYWKPYKKKKYNKKPHQSLVPPQVVETNHVVECKADACTVELKAPLTIW